VKGRLLLGIAALVAVVGSAGACGHQSHAQSPSGPTVVRALPETIPPNGAVWHFGGGDLTMKPPGDVDTASLKVKTAADAIATMDSAHDGKLQAVLCLATARSLPHVRDRLCWVVCWTWATPEPASNVIIGGIQRSPRPEPSSTVMFDKTISLVDARTGELVGGWCGHQE
jgi:hypothetical protein